MEAAITIALTAAAIWLGCRIAQAMARHRNEPDGSDPADEWVEGSGHAAGHWARRG